jgi:chromosome segregation ATPase
VRTELGARVDELTTSAESRAAEIERLNAELAEQRDGLAAARNAQEEIAARAADLQAAVDAAESELGRVRGQLSATAGRLNEVNAVLTAAEQERDTALGELDEERSRADRLREAAAAAEADLAQARRRTSCAAVAPRSGAWPWRRSDSPRTWCPSACPTAPWRVKRIASPTP